MILILMAGLAILMQGIFMIRESSDCNEYIMSGTMCLAGILGISIYVLEMLDFISC